MQQTQTVDTAGNEAISSGFTGRLRGSLGLVQTRFASVEERARTQWVDAPSQLRASFAKLIERVRSTLDLPSRRELANLVERIEALDARIAALSGEVAAPAPEAAPEASEGEAADSAEPTESGKNTRRAKIKDAAKRTKKSR